MEANQMEIIIESLNQVGLAVGISGGAVFGVLAFGAFALLFVVKCMRSK
jgi:hypothetical protein